MGWNTGKISSLEKERRDDEGDGFGEDFNKQKGIYSCFSEIPYKNPFCKIAIINNVSGLILLDTGADVSIINRNNLPNNITIQKCETLVQSACGNSLKIMGKVYDIPLQIDGKKLKFNPLVIEGPPYYTIVGADCIQKHPEILKDCCKRSISDKNTTKNINVIDEIIKNNQELFKTQISLENVCNIGKHAIDTDKNNPIAQNNFRIQFHLSELIDKDIKKILELGIIRESKSPWNSRLIPVTKKDGTLRLCIDYRPLNKITIKDRYPIPRIDEILDTLSGAKYFSTLDATTGYYQIAMEERDIEKTAFS